MYKPPLEVRIRMSQDAKLELLKRAISGVDVTIELLAVDTKLRKYGRLRREKKKKQKKFK